MTQLSENSDDHPIGTTYSLTRTHKWRVNKKITWKKIASRQYEVIEGDSDEIGIVHKVFNCTWPEWTIVPPVN